MRKLTITDGLIGLAFLLGLVLRVYGLGQIPLNDAEAGWAMQALHVARGGSTIGAEASLVLWSSSLFRVLEPSTFLTRLFPAMIGSLIILVPILLRKQFGDLTSILMAFGLAFDPLLIGISRQADGLSMAITLASLAAGFWVNRKSLALGLCLGFFLVCGPSSWLGLTILGVIGAVTWLIFDRQTFKIQVAGSKLSWQWVGFGIGIGLITGGSIFLLVPKGFSGVLEGLVQYLGSWKFTATSQVTSSMTIFALLIYLSFPILLSLTGLIRGIRERIKIDLMLIASVLSVAIVLILFPGFEIRTLAWLSPLLWLIAARQLSLMEWSHWSAPAILIEFITIVMMIFILFNMNALETSAEPELRLSAIVISLLIILLAFFLVWWGWSIREARQGLSTGILLIFLVLMLASAWRVTGLTGRLNAELINSAPVITDEDLLMSTIHDFSNWNTGEKDKLDIAVFGIQSNALDWSLRDYRNYDKVEAILPGENPSIVITSAELELNQTAPYTGQVLVLREEPIWTDLDARGYIGWLMRRDIITSQQTMIIWVRSDLFPGATVTDNTENEN